MSTTKFERTVREILRKYPQSPLAKRWEDATSFGKGASAKAFFVHDAPDSVNVIWLNSDGIRDIVWLPSKSEEGAAGDSTESMFNFIPLRSVVTLELREAAHITKAIGLLVDADLVVSVILASSPVGQTFWVSSSAERPQFRAFLKAVLTAMIAIP